MWLILAIVYLLRFVGILLKNICWWWWWWWRNRAHVGYHDNDDAARSSAYSSDVIVCSTRTGWTCSRPPSRKTYDRWRRLKGSDARPSGSCSRASAFFSSTIWWCSNTWDFSLLCSPITSAALHRAYRVSSAMVCSLVNGISKKIARFSTIFNEMTGFEKSFFPDTCPYRIPDLSIRSNNAALFNLLLLIIRWFWTNLWWLRCDLQTSHTAFASMTSGDASEVSKRGFARREYVAKPLTRSSSNPCWRAIGRGQRSEVRPGHVTSSTWSWF